MTELPPEKREGLHLPTQSQTTFRKHANQGRGDTSAWTDTPQQKAEKAKNQLLLEN